MFVLVQNYCRRWRPGVRISAILSGRASHLHDHALLWLAAILAIWQTPAVAIDHAIPVRTGLAGPAHLSGCWRTGWSEPGFLAIGRSGLWWAFSHPTASRPSFSASGELHPNWPPSSEYWGLGLLQVWLGLETAIAFCLLLFGTWPLLSPCRSMKLAAARRPRAMAGRELNRCVSLPTPVPTPRSSVPGSRRLVVGIE